MLSRQARVRRVRHWIANRGIRGLLYELFWRARLKLRGDPIPGRPRPESGPHGFDLAFNVDTTGLVWGEALVTDEGKHHEAKYWATGYYGVAPSSFTDALRRLALDWPRYSFVDIGCGKGRALLLALRHPFRAAVGIELSSDLAAVAKANLQTFSAPWRVPGLPVNVVIGDATTYTFPNTPMVLFLYHPFAAPIMQKFLDHLGRTLQENPRPLYLLYENPELANMLGRCPFLTQLWDAHFPMSNADVAADRFASSYERIIAYRSTDHI